MSNLKTIHSRQFFCFRIINALVTTIVILRPVKTLNRVAKVFVIMVQFRFCLFLAALSCCSLGTLGSVTTQKPVTIRIPVDATPEHPIINVPVPHVASVEPEKKIETTPEPAQPVTTPAPTTPAATTPAPATPAPTTPAPTTPAPTPPAPTPAPKPTPISPPEQGNWYFNNTANNVTCIVVQFAAQLDVKYPTLENNGSLANLTLNVPANATVVGGSCDEMEQLITINWPAGTSNISNAMTLTYSKNDTTKTYGLKSLDITLSPDLFTNASFKSVVELKHNAEWQTALGTSYRCVPPARLSLAGDAASGTAAYLTFSKLQEEAFRNINGTGFSSPRDCGSGDVPDAVPIAVGCALAGLVLVVLIAYFVGRRRSAARGYLSM